MAQKSDDLPASRISRDRDFIDTLKNRNETLKLDLNRESRDARKSNNAFIASDLNRLQEEGARYIRKIEAERKKVEELENEITLYHEKIIQQKARMGGINAAQINNKLVQKQIRQLENRMDKNLTKYNETIAENRALKQRIDDYRRERVIFDAIYKKLEKELHEKKKEMALIIESSKEAYKLREKAQDELISLQNRSEQDKNEFTKQFYDLGKAVKLQQQMLQDMRLQQFDKAQEKLKTLTALVSTKHENDGANSGFKNESDGLKSAVAIEAVGSTSHGSVQNKGDKSVSLHLTSEKIMNYEDSLRKIQENTGIYDIDELISKFLEAEEQNFSLFNYVNDINSEIERLEHNISDMRNQIEKYRGQGMSSDTQRKKNLRSLEEKLAKTEKKNEEYEVRYHSAKRVLDQLKNGIHSICTRIGTSSNLNSGNNNNQNSSSNNVIANSNNSQASQSGANDEMLGNQGITESNMMQYLGLVEQRTAEILQAYAASQVQLSGGIAAADLSLQLPTVIPSDTTTKLTIQPPALPLNSHDDVSEGNESEDEQDERPLTRQELEKRTAKEINRKSGLLNQN